MSGKPLLCYVEARGFAEIIRLTLCLGGVEFDERNVTTREEYLKNCNDGTFLFRRVPYFKWGGVELVESAAIVRYVARKTGLMGKDAEETARIDMMYEASRDFLKPYFPIGFMKLDELIKEAKDTVLPKFLPIFNKILEDNATGFIVGDKVTLADAGLLQCLLASEDVFGEEVLNGYTEVQKFLQRMKGLPNVENYVDNIRRPPNTKEMATKVRAIFNWTTENKPKK